MSARLNFCEQVNKSGLKVCEVPISCKYGDSVGVETSTKNPLHMELGLLMSIIKLVVEDRPLPFLGIPGILSLICRRVFRSLDDDNVCCDAFNRNKHCFGIYCVYSYRVLFDFNSYHTVRNNTISQIKCKKMST